MLIAFYVWLTRRIRAGGGPWAGAKGLFSGRSSTPAGKRQDVTFADVAGQDEAKREVAELVEFLRDPDRFAKVGAEVPHGVLLMGPPGTGKALIAREIADEAGGAVLLHLRLGVHRVRRMFEEARKRAPAVIFIDELDSIGRTRGTGLGAGHDEREQTLNR